MRHGLPPPTDDELLHAFVDDCPNSAMQDYVRREGLEHDLLWDGSVREHFEQEWNRRMARR